MSQHDGDELIQELRDPIASLPRHFGTEIAYEPRARGLLIGPGITLARLALIALLRWWVHAVVERQDHVNRLIVRALEQLEQGAPKELERRIWALEERERERESAVTLEELETRMLVQSATPQRAVSTAARRAVLDALSDHTDLLVIGVVPLELLRELHAAGKRIVVVDPDVIAVSEATLAGAEAHQLLPDVYLQGVPDGSLGGVFSMTVVTQLSLARMAVLLKRLTRALAASSLLVLLAPDPADPAGLFGIWDDPASERPVPGSLLGRVLGHAGFTHVDVRRIDASGAGPGDVPQLLAVARPPGG